MGSRALMASSMSRRGARGGWPRGDGEQHVETRSARWWRTVVESVGAGWARKPERGRLWWVAVRLCRETKGGRGGRVRDGAELVLKPE